MHQEKTVAGWRNGFGVWWDVIEGRGRPKKTGEWLVRISCEKKKRERSLKNGLIIPKTLTPTPKHCPGMVWAGLC